jgi:hypothetical protein
VTFVVYERPAGAPEPRRYFDHPDHAIAEHHALMLVQRYVLGGWREVEVVRDGDRWRRWVLRLRGDWAAVELREHHS